MFSPPHPLGPLRRARANRAAATAILRCREFTVKVMVTEVAAASPQEQPKLLGLPPPGPEAPSSDTLARSLSRNEIRDAPPIGLLTARAVPCRRPRSSGLLSRRPRSESG